MPEARWRFFAEAMREIYDLRGAAAVLAWDEQTYMPRGGAEARAQQKATLQRLIHRRLIDPRLAECVAQLGDDAAAGRLTEEQAAQARLAKRAVDQAAKLPEELVVALSEAASAGFQAWLEARKANDFAPFRPALERLVRLQREKADALGWTGERYDALLDLFEPSMRTETVGALFGELREALVPLVAAIGAQAHAVDDGCLHRRFPADRQRAFVDQLLRAIGFSDDHGRLDLSEHPFTIAFAPTDVRITTRINETSLGDAVFATLHEAGHGFYERGIPAAYAGTFLGMIDSLALHESQSRLWENLIGRSLPFWRHHYPALQATFPEQLGHVPLATFYRAINKVQPSLIRTEADEVTYNLHIFMRFELERAMLDGALAVADVPDAWNEKTQAYFGLTPPDMVRGVLQDVHWSADSFGYFPTYVLGNLLAAQFHETLRQDLPDLDRNLAGGDYEALHAWLRDRIHAHGARYTADELVRRVTGRPLAVAPLIRYLERKYGEIYRL